MSIGRVITIVAAVAVTAALVGSAVAYANAGDDSDGAGQDNAIAADDAAATAQDGHGHGHEATAGSPSPSTSSADATGGRRGDGGGREHPVLPPYDEREAAASAEDRAAADELRAEVAATLVRYADVGAAVADGYRAPRRPNSNRHHYLDRSLVRDGDVLDPAAPEGLVYHAVEGRDPVLLGAFFVAPPGVEAEPPAGDLVVWHSHDPACPGFHASADEPCTGSRRMLHVWTVDTVTLASRRDPGRTGEVHVTDPFGAPFRAAFARGPG